MGDQFSTAYRATDGNIRCVRCAIDHRETQRIQQAAADTARNRAQSVASGGNTDPGSRLTLQTQVSNNTQDTTSRTNRGKPKNKTGGTKKAAKKDKGEKKKPKKKKQSTNKKKRKGQR
ncbi:hypothetical protein [Mycolicibacterium porcinum]|uniref:hypothetical protein n=1 Tax=Mycolicibacterium porcinum TaxID=39693 RepID=UPI0008493405|nr:hypothetical protein [Mycolicibacterium porcinum]ODR25536.1 hypothetical protein BHQ19_11795 [Mycolicibacterium porcinum]